MIQFLLPLLEGLGAAGAAGGLSGGAGLMNALGGGAGGLGTMAGSTMAGGMQGATQGSGLMGALSGGNFGSLFNGMQMSDAGKKAAPWQNPDEKKPDIGMGFAPQQNRFVNGLNRV